jgi:hypothetical protein
MNGNSGMMGAMKSLAGFLFIKEKVGSVNGLLKDLKRELDLVFIELKLVDILEENNPLDGVFVLGMLLELRETLSLVGWLFMKMNTGVVTG